MGNVGILKSQLFIVLVFVFSLGLITIAVASPPGEDELKQLAAQYSPTDKLTLSAFGAPCRTISTGRAEPTGSHRSIS